MTGNAIREALEPFAKVAEHDIGTDEADADFFRPMDRHNRAPRLTVGDLRRARTAYDAIGSGPAIAVPRKIMQAIAEGYNTRGREDRFVIVTNPDFLEDNGEDPDLVFDLSTHTAAGAGPVGEAVADDLETRAWNCADWPTWLFEIIDKTNEAADRLDMSSEQAHAFAALSALAARPVDEPGEVEQQRGWIYFNPDAGTEWAENHPVESGEVSDAEDIRPGTAEELFKQLLPAWRDLAAEASRRETAEAALAETRKALRYIAEGNLGSEPWQANYERIKDAARAALTGDAQEAGR